MAGSDAAKRIVEGIEKRLEYRKAHSKEDDKKYFYETLYYEIMKTFYTNIAYAKEMNKPLAVYGALLPPEIFYAFDMVPMNLENFFLLTANNGVDSKYLDAAKGFGYPDEACSLHLLALGMAQAGELPRPDLVLTSGLFCDSSEKFMEVFADFYQCPLYCLDSGYGKTEESVKYVTKELEGLINFIEERFHRKLDYDRLKEIAELSRGACEYFFRIAELRKSVPAPSNMRSFFRDYGVPVMAAGLPEAVRYGENRYEALKEQVARKEEAVPGEKYRVAWWGAYPYFDLKILDWLAQEYKAVIVADVVDPWILNRTTMQWVGDTSDPLEYLARKTIGYGSLRSSGPYNDTCGGTRKDILLACEEAQVNCSVVFGYFRCKNFGGFVRLIYDDMRDILGVPTMILEGDLFDPTVVSPERMRDQFRQFFSVLEK